MARQFELLGRYLAARREQLGLTQRDVARALGYSGPQFISNIERSVAGLPLKKYRQLAAVLGVDIDELLRAAVPPAELPAVREHLGLLLRDQLAGPPAVLPLVAQVKCERFIWAESLEEDPEPISVPAGLFRPERFVIRAQGDSMADEIKNGDLCIFDPDVSSPNHRIVVAQLEGDEVGSTIKWYEDHGSSVILRPENIVEGLYEPLVLVRHGRAYVYEHDKHVNLLLKGVMVGLMRQY